MILGSLPETPKISVVSTVYQHERFLERTLDSVLAQDWPRERLQHVLVNDGSTDRSREILDAYASRHPFVQVVHQQNGGLKAAINTAMEHVDGDLIRLVSGDDILPPGALRVAAEHMIAHPNVGLLYSDMTVIDDEDRVTEPSFMRAHRLPPHTGRPLARLLAANFVSGGAIMLRREMKEIIHPLPAEAAWEDYFWAWKVSQVADLDYLDVPTYLYRRHSSNMSYGADGEKRARSYQVETLFRRLMLWSIEPGQVTASEAIQGFIGLTSLAGFVMRATGDAPAVVMPVSADQRDAGAAEAAIALDAAAHGDVQRAATFCVRSLGRDPHRDDMMQLINELHQALPAPPPPATAPLTNDPPALHGLRGFVTVADAGELCAHPDLLRAYGTTFGAADDATLLIHAAGWDPERAGRELGELLEACGLDDADAPDLLAHPGPGAQRYALLEQAHAVLSAEARDDGPRVYDAREVDALRAQAERQWAAESRAVV